MVGHTNLCYMVSVSVSGLAVIAEVELKFGNTGETLF